MFIHPISLLTLFTVSSYQLFLQNFDTNQETSLGTLGQGIEQLGSDVSKISEALNKSTSTLDDQVDTSVSIVSILGTSLLTAQETSLERELNSINLQIAHNQALLDTISYCEDFATCSACTSISECVWCSSLKQCFSGSSSGPKNNECSDFEYARCSVTGCELYTQCGSCISDETCSWCANGNYCRESVSKCESAYVYSQSGNSNCPVSKQKSSKSDTYLYRGTEERTKQEIEAEQQELYKEKDDLQTDIDKLISDSKEIESNAKEAKNIEPADMTVSNNVIGLGDEVDHTALAEVQKERIFQKDLAEQTKKAVVAEVTKAVDKDTDNIIEAVHLSYDKIEKDIDDLRVQISNGLSALNASVTAEQQATSDGSVTVNTTESVSAQTESPTSGSASVESGAAPESPPAESPATESGTASQASAATESPPPSPDSAGTTPSSTEAAASPASPPTDAEVTF